MAPIPLRRTRPVRLFWALVIAGLALYLLMNYLMFMDVVSQFGQRGPAVSMVYLTWLGCGFLVFFALLVTARPQLLGALFLLFFISLSTNYAYTVIGKRPLSLDVMEWLPNEMAQFPRAWSEFQVEIVAAIVRAVAILGAFLLIRAAIRRDRTLADGVLSHARPRQIALASFTAFTAAGILLQPPNSVAETNLFVFGLPALFSSTPDLRAVPVSPSRAPLAEKVVLVVDESVTREVYDKVVAQAVRHFPATDFGEAASTANCSAASNALLRWGLEREDIGKPDYDPRTNPTIWGYAKGAGFRTVLIDGQSTGAMHNYISRKEFALIDEFVPAYTGLDTDHRIATLLSERLRQPGRELIYVVKHGTHFPYEMNYPVGTTPDNAPRAVKYAAAVAYSTRIFFERLAKDLKLSGILFIYTSDHGQDLENRSTHCNPDPRPEEYSVPLIVITDIPEMRQVLGSAENMRNHASHLNIFPTVLYSLGYAREWIESSYGPTLAGPPSAYITYISLGWTPRSKKRHTVESTAFIESVEFPRRKAAGSR